LFWGEDALQCLYWYNQEMNDERSHTEALSPMAILAAISFCTLLIVAVGRIVSARSMVVATNVFAATSSVTSEEASPSNDEPWQRDLLDISSSSPVVLHDTHDPDGIANIAGNVVGTFAETYAVLQKSGSFTPEKGALIAQNIAQTLQANVSHPTYTASDFSSSPDTSYQRMLTYRSDMREALAPLLKNPDYELKLYANYIASHDVSYLDQLKEEVANYQLAVRRVRAVVVPANLLSFHVAIINALAAFSATLDAMIAHVDDPFASAALLRTYQDKEQVMLNAFNDLAQYERSRTP